MKRSLFFVACILASVMMQAQEKQNDYLPFVDRGKTWIVTRFTPGHDDIDEVEYYIPQDVEEVDGKNYYKMKTATSNNTETETYLIREESQKVYYYDPDLKMEFLVFDYSLKEGDTYETYSYETHGMVTYTVQSVEDYTEGPQVKEYYYDENTGSMAVRYRYLRKWVVSSYIESVYCYPPKVWVEGVGSLERPLTNLYQGSYTLDCLAYVLYNGQYDLYLPFSFNASSNTVLWYGRNMPTGEKDDNSEDEHHKLTYELEGNRLHVYGEVFCNCGPNHYAYFIEEPSDDHSVRKLHFKIQDVEPLVWCEALHTTDFYVEGLPPTFDYIIIDNQGEEHPVINKMAYRPFVEEGKVWKVGSTIDISDNLVKMVEYYYFDGDTIIDGKTCKQMMCQRYFSPDFSDDYWTQLPSLSKVGAWYEEDKKVYNYTTVGKQFMTMYDFSLEANETLDFVLSQYDGCPPCIIGPKQTEGLKGFKGVYRDIMWLEGEGTNYCTTWLEGVGGIQGPTANLGDGQLRFFLMSCTVGDEVIYLNDEYEDGATPEGARKKRFDFTHTIKIQPKAPIKREKSDVYINSSEREVARPKVKSRIRKGEEQSLYGEYNDQQLGIHLDPLNDAYLVSIANESGKVVYEKTINAGSIVGLNIDISAYAEGRYTVTVENSSESFTGEFDTQTTGIEAIRNNKEEVRTEIYNLQGQRLSSLQKGLNIVNGKKIIMTHDNYDK